MSGIDASIYGNIGRGVKSVGEYDAEYAQAESAKQAQKLNALNLLMGERKLQAEDRGIADQAALRQVVGGFGADDAANVQSLFKAGRLSEAQDYQKAIAEAGAKRADTGYKVAQTTKLTDEQARAKRTEAIQHIGAMQTAEEALQSLSTSKDVPEQARAPLLQQLQGLAGNPQGFREWQLKTILTLATPQQQATAMMPKTEQQNLGATMRTVSIDPITGKPTVADEAKIAESANNVSNNARIAAEGAANRGVQVRGQNMTDARSRETNSATMTKPFEVTGPDGLPLLVRQDKQGNITPVEGFGPKSGSSKPLNDTQAKALLFGTRMQESDKVLTDLAKSGTELPSMTKRVAESVPLIGGALGLAANVAASPGQQQVEQAQRDFINAVLRRESGAAIAESEFANARKQYFPEVGDGADVKKQKARNRQLAVDGLLAEVPEGRRQSITPKASQPAAASPSAAGAPTVSNW